MNRELSIYKSHLFDFRPSKSKLGILDIFQSFSTSIRVILFEIDKAKEVFIIFHLVYVKSFELYIHKCIIYEEHSWHFFYATAINKVTKFFLKWKTKGHNFLQISLLKTQLKIPLFVLLKWDFKWVFEKENQLKNPLV